MFRMLMCLAIAVICGCQSADSGTGKSASKPPATAPANFTGTLRSGIAAIGGEHTGWVLAGDGSSGGIETDVSKVQKEAKANEGKRVTIEGKMIEKNYVERGKVKILAAEKITSAPK